MTIETPSVTGTGEITSSKIIKDIKTVAEDADGLLKNSVSAVTGQISDLRAKAGTKMEEVQSQFEGTCASVAGQAKDMVGNAQRYVKQNPWRVLGMAAAAGVLLGLMRSHRCRDNS